MYTYINVYMCVCICIFFPGILQIPDMLFHQNILQYTFLTDNDFFHNYSAIIISYTIRSNSLIISF